MAWCQSSDMAISLPIMNYYNTSSGKTESVSRCDLKLLVAMTLRKLSPQLFDGLLFDTDSTVLYNQYHRKMNRMKEPTFLSHGDFTI